MEEFSAEALAWTLAAFGLLKGMSGFFDFISQKTKNKTDDKIAKFIGVGAGWMSKVIDFFTANSKPKK